LNEMEFSQIEEDIEHGTAREILAAISRVAGDDSPDCTATLAKLLFTKCSGMGNVATSRLLARALVSRGQEGIDCLISAVMDGPGMIIPSAALQELWAMSNGRHVDSLLFRDDELGPELNSPLNPEVVKAAGDAFHDLIVESRSNSNLFRVVLHVVNQLTMVGPERADLELLQEQVFDMFTDATIQLTKS